MTDAEAERRAMNASGILENPLFQECIRNLKAHYRASWEHTKPMDVELREEIFRMLKLVDQFTGQLTKCLNDGEIVKLRTKQSRAAEG